MKKDKKLTEALKTHNIQMLKELKNDGIDLSEINISMLSEHDKKENEIVKKISNDFIVSFSSD